MKHAFRTLARSPGFTAVAVLTLALGIGATTTFFSVLYGVALRALPYENPNALVELRNLGKLGNNDGRISLAELRDYRARQRSLSALGAYSLGRVTLSLDDGAERVIEVRVTANLFPLLGAQPAKGRNFTDVEEREANNRVILVSDEFRRTHFADADVLGRTLRLNGVENTIVGVMPAGFSFSPGEPGAGIWKPLDTTPRGEADRTDRSFATVARLAPGISLTAAAADLKRVAQQLQVDQLADYPADAEWSISVAPLRPSQYGEMLAPLGALMSAAAAVLLIACVNVSIMFLLRAAVRRREMTIRLAIGASRWHILRHLLAESSIVCTLGAIAGLALAAFGIEALKAFPPQQIQRLNEVTIDGTVALFTVGVLLVVTIVVGLAPALTLFKTRAAADLTHLGRSTESRSAVRLREVLTIIEIALAVMLLIGGGLAFRSLNKLLKDDIGFTTEQLFTFKTNLTPKAYPDLARATRFYDQLVARIESIPGVSSVAAVSYLPLSTESQFSLAAPVGDARSATVAWRVVRGPYFSTMGVTLLGGRFLDATDRSDAALVAVVDDALVSRFWPSTTEALGKSIRFGTDAEAQTRTIVGVVHHMKHAGPGKGSLPEAYVPHAQFYQRGMYTVVKAAQAANLLPLIRARLAKVDPSVPMYFVETMENRFAGAIALPRFTARLVGAFSILALVLAGVGIFGVTGYSVAQRSREFGIRIALGAQRTHLASLVLGRTARLALTGSVVGTVAAFYLAGLMESLLFGVDPVDPPTLVLAAAVIVLTALLASLVPVSRALRVSPVDALRAE